MTTAAGDEDSAEDAVEAPEVPCHIFLPVVPAARVIGKMGVNIKAIRENSGASVKILQKELPLEMQQREDRVALLEGSPLQVREAIYGVLERVFDRSGIPDGGRSRDRAHIVELVVPERSGSHLIGQGGERIKTLIKETGCDLHVVKEPMAGLAEQKRVRVTGGSIDEVAGAVWRLQEVLTELVAGGVLKLELFELHHAAVSANSVAGAGFRQGVGINPLGSAPSRYSPNAGGREKEVPIRLLLAQEEAAWVVGKRGLKISRLRDLAKVQMNDAEAPPFDETERFLEISSASLEQRLRVVHMVLEDLSKRPEGCSESRLLVPTEHFGSVMGHRGENIRRIMESTGTRVQQHKAEKNEDGTDYRLRLIKVKGDEPQRLEVIRLVHVAVETRGRGDAVTSGNTEGAGVSSRLAAGSAAAGVTAATGGLGSQALSGFFNGGISGATSGAAGLAEFAAAASVAATASPSADGISGLPSAGAADTAQLSLQLAMPNQEVAEMLASSSSGIAWRAGVQLAVAKGASGIPILQVVGTAVGNSVACYLIQDRLFMMH